MHFSHGARFLESSRRLRCPDQPDCVQVGAPIGEGREQKDAIDEEVGIPSILSLWLTPLACYE